MSSKRWESNGKRTPLPPEPEFVLQISGSCCNFSGTISISLEKCSLFTASYNLHLRNLHMHARACTCTNGPSKFEIQDNSINDSRLARCLSWTLLCNAVFAILVSMLCSVFWCFLPFARWCSPLCRACSPFRKLQQRIYQNCKMQKCVPIGKHRCHQKWKMQVL